MKKTVKKFNPVTFIIIAAILLIARTDLGDRLMRSGKNTQGVIPAEYENELMIKYIDVGQGDSELIRLPDGEVMLIDAGTGDSFYDITDELDALSCDSIDYLVATHPHADHIGSMEDIVREYEIGNIYMPRVDYDTKTYLGLLEAIDDKGLGITAAKAGELIFEKPGIRAEFLAPDGEYGGLNDYSAVVKLTYNDKKFLFCGDAEKESEKRMLLSGYDLSADVLKLGHHGSSTSTSDDFFEEVAPEYAIISCGADNEYGHPHRETLKKIKDISVFRTDEMGTITLYSDGSGIEFETEK